jgi:cytochrome c biogenesis protein CcmG/thiol:disulfide interchange protein DsbE
MSNEATQPRASGRFRPILFLPVLMFVAIAAIFIGGITGGDPSKVPSVLIDQPVPQFVLPPLEGIEVPGIASGDLARGRVTLVNVWASWCGPCRLEHPILMALSERDDLDIVGINYKDDPANARRFLRSLGQPFAAIGVDENGRAAVDWGVYGVPESFLVDGAGKIRFKWVGPLTEEVLATEVLPALTRAAGNKPQS